MRIWRCRIRTFLAYAVLLILSHKQFLADELIDEAKFALLGVACIPFYHGLENLALQETNAGTVATIMASAPLFTAFVVIALHHSFRLHWMTKLGIVTVATGMCLIWFDNHVIQQLPAAGFYLALGAALAWACYSALLKSVHKYGAVFMARKTFGWGLIAVMPFYLMEDAAPVEALTDPVSAALLVFLAVGPTTLCTLLWQRAAREAGAQQIRNLLFLIPVIAMIAGLVILDESVTFIGVMGAAMILCGVWCSDLAQQIRNLLFLIPVIAMIAGLVILDESVTFIGVMGAAMILCGVWCSDLGMKRVNAVLAGADADALSAKFTLF